MKNPERLELVKAALLEITTINLKINVIEKKEFDKRMAVIEANLRALQVDLES